MTIKLKENQQNGDPKRTNMKMKLKEEEQSKDPREQRKYKRRL